MHDKADKHNNKKKKKNDNAAIIVIVTTTVIIIAVPTIMLIAISIPMPSICDYILTTCKIPGPLFRHGRARRETKESAKTGPLIRKGAFGVQGFRV